MKLFTKEYESITIDSDLEWNGLHPELLLHFLGFLPRPNKDGSVHKWFHPMMGDDREDNRFLFDPATDDLNTLGVKIFRLGARLGTRVLKLQIKNTLENH